MSTWSIILNCNTIQSPLDIYQALIKAKQKDYFELHDIKIYIDSVTKIKNSDICRNIVELCREQIVHLDIYVDVCDDFLENISILG